MLIHFTTIVRAVPHEQSGEIVALDWSSKRVIARRPLYADDPDVVDGNPRGGARGGRGILPRGGRLWVASYHTLHQFDQDLREMGRLSHPLFVGLHELCDDPRDDSIWVCSTAIDAALRLDASGRVVESWWPRETPRLQRDFGLSPLVIDRHADNRTRWLDQSHAKSPSHCHLNAVRVHHGEVFALLNRLGVVYNVTRDEVLVHDPLLHGAHNLSFRGDRCVINDSRGRRVRMYGPDGACERSIDLAKFAPVAALLEQVGPVRPAALPLFVRGQHLLPDGRLFVGLSPASIALLDLDRGELLDLFTLSRDVHHTIHGLHVSATGASGASFR
ncbi:MAG: hypothetical protein HRU76_04240 [Phycisphaeraceae bacterium]|nr:hypothetical protein [Phycisphaerales bacterium]QOJ16843.1 MAG: hypothetical protein HRU76_04240 [Phycisphaeraceae bacterium]